MMTRELESDDEFVATIDYVTKNSIGSVNYHGNQISIGPVNCEKGREVQVRYLGRHESLGRDVGFALCLDEDILGPEYDKWVRKVMDALLPDRPPEVGEVTYAEIKEIQERNLGVAILGGERIQLGPVYAQEGDLVRIVGVTNTCAEVRDNKARGENYATRFKILSKQTTELPVDIGDEITTVIAEGDENALIGYVGDAPIKFPGHGAEIGQKIDGRVTGFEGDRLVGEITETYDEVGRIDESTHWARMQWLQNAGFDEEPFREFAVEFIGGDPQNLPASDERLRDALVAEGIRLGIADKLRGADSETARTHISGLRHWVVHKLAAVLDDPSAEEGTDWFRDILWDRKGPTLTFLGDVLRLAEGYYAPAPTRAIMTSESEAVLISGKPSRVFLDAGLSLEFRGIARVITNTSRDELKDHDIPVQSREEYVGINGLELFTEEALVEFVAKQPRENWGQDTDWEAYTGRYGFQHEENPLEVQQDNGTKLSFWRVPVEYGTDTYQLKVMPEESDSAAMISVPSRYRKHVCLLLDSLGGRQQHVDLQTGTQENVIVNCDFAPPRPQMRWLYAVGAEWLETSSQMLQWRIRAESAESVKNIFAQLPVSITNNT
ncbi:hypothetical protein [Haloarcula nitratireducens]|uniref:Uncharacterized protein n=1 Tax=Haloarcula nitratireducens TaxID=2487749 RepID=A0AAW4PHY4_9EURY|nr:hypothetical protein [Halomicroarcula nitratireducens]MBX0297533.1 hypothetical protein [Halomicroarcula nitratireducens]